MKEMKEMTDEEIVREGLVNSINHKIEKEFIEFRDDYISKLEGKISALRIEEKKMLTDPPMADHQKILGIKNDITHQSPAAFFYLAVWEDFFLIKGNYEDLPIKTLKWIEKKDTFIGRLYEDYYLKVQEASFLFTEQILDMVNGYYRKDNPEDFEEEEWQDPDYKAQLKEDLKTFKEDLEEDLKTFKEDLEKFEKLAEEENDCLNCPEAGKCDSSFRQFCEANRKSSKEREDDEEEDPNSMLWQDPDYLLQKRSEEGAKDE